MAATPASSNPAGEIDHAEVGGFGPALRRDAATLGINTDNDLAGERFAGSAHQVRVAHGDGAEDDAADALGQPHADGREVADAAAELAGHCDGGEDRLDRRRVDRLTGECAVEIDDVQILKTLRLERFRLRGGAVVEHGRSRHVAKLQAHALAVFQINGWKKDHRCAGCRTLRPWP